MSKPNSFEGPPRKVAASSQQSAFGLRLRIARTDLGLSQQRVADMIGKTAKFISTVEAGISGVKDEDREVLLRELGFMFTKSDGDLESHHRLVAEGVFGEAQRNYIDGCMEKVSHPGADRGLDLWFTNPDDLPVYSDEDFQSAWWSNLQRGINYHLVWNFDNNGRDSLKSLIKAFRGKSSVGLSGKIAIYPFIERVPSCNNMSLIEEYVYFRQKSKNDKDGSIFCLKPLGIIFDEVNEHSRSEADEDKKVQQFFRDCPKGLTQFAIDRGMKIVKISGDDANCFRSLMYDFHFKSMALVGYVPKGESFYYIDPKLVLELRSIGKIQRNFHSEPSDGDKGFILLGDDVALKFSELVNRFSRMRLPLIEIEEIKKMLKNEKL